MRILEGEFKEGDQIVVDVEGGEIAFAKARAAAAASA
jgi:hypothetical protein